MVPQSQFLDRVLHIPVACRDGCPQCETAQNTVEIPLCSVWCLTILRSCSDKFQQFSDRLVCKLCRKPWRFHRCAVMDVAVPMQRQVRAVSGRCLRPVHRQGHDGLRGGFLAVFSHFSDSVHSDVSPDFLGALDDSQFFVIKGSGLTGTLGV